MTPDIDAAILETLAKKYGPIALQWRVYRDERAIWAAATNAALERAAKELETIGSMGPHDEARGWAMACADAVRALKG
jgi:hypothetical protein